MLAVNDVSKAFGSTVALVGVDVDLLEGEIIAIVGASGSGKTTLLHCMCALLVPDSGTVVYKGTKVSSLSDDQRARLRREQFGLVFQSHNLVPELRAIDNVALPLLLRGSRMSAARVVAGSWLERLGVGTVADRQPSAMSGGQRQRVAVARAMALGPSIVFADEPTGSLDSESGRVVLDALREPVRELGCALVLVTHDLDVAAVADRSVTLHDGRVCDDQPSLPC